MKAEYYFRIPRINKDIPIKDKSLIKFLKEDLQMTNDFMSTKFTNKIQIRKVGKRFGYMELCDLADLLNDLSNEWYETPECFFVEQFKI